MVPTRPWINFPFLLMYFCMTFAGMEEAMKGGPKILSQLLKEFFEDKPKAIEN